MKKIFLLLCIFLSLFTFSGCKNKDDSLELNDQVISHEEKFGGVYIQITIADFNELGFKFGDSLDITFSNGYELLDLPYYNGYYTNTGEPLLVGYPGYPYIRAGINNGEDLFNLANLSETDTASIKLNKAGKYLDIQEALDIHYTDIQGDIPDEVFGNFRVVNVGNLKTDILYRSASPCDNQHNRANVVDTLITNKVNTIINLSDNDAELLEHINKDDFNSPYFYSIYEANRVIALSMNMNFKSSSSEDEEVASIYSEYNENTFAGKLIKGLEFMLENDGPYLVHCVEGKDRTGFVSMIIEALAGASYQEIIDDYMITYDNYYGINLETYPSKYNILKEKNIDEMLKTVINDDSVDLTTADYNYYCKKYLANKGMDEAKIEALEEKITK
ncbi:MAG: tyrosine-protein phosphatase [Acholeplasmatales bacterium]|nr:tyrosine-protein phosphatase [Acholeplasmatales bacterium]